MEPLYQNLIVTLLGFIYVFSVVGIMDYAVKKGFPQDLSRKIVHIAAASWLIFWYLYDLSHWSRFLNIAPAFLWTVLLIIKGLTASADDKAVKTMTRTGDRRELLKGPLFFTIVMNIMGTVFLNSQIAFYSMGFLGWGDGLAPVFGKRFGKHKYKIYTEKTIEGSVAFFIFGMIGAVIFNLLFHQPIHIQFILILAVITTLVEAFSPRDIDNILIPAVVILVYYFFY